MFVKGQSGNPKGRPKKGKTLTDLLERELQKKYSVENADGSEIKISGKIAVIQQIIGLAFGDRTPPDTKLACLKYIYERIDGPIVQRLDHLITKLPEVIEIDYGNSDPQDENTTNP